MQPVIQNIARLSSTPERARALSVLESGYRAIDTRQALHAAVRKRGNRLMIQGKSYDLSQYQRIALIGIGKCSAEAGMFFEDLLGKTLWGGMVLDTKKAALKKIRSLVGTHPLPSQKNIAHTRKILSFIDALNPFTDLLVFVISGGGSSLFCMPEGIALSAYVRLSLALHKSGANIHELNCVRKHLESIKGGKLAARIKPLPTVALYLSDVLSQTNAQNLSTIASGPLYPDAATNTRAKKVLEKYKLWKTFARSIGKFSETPKQSPMFSHIKHHVVLTNMTALKAMESRAQHLKLKPKIVSATFGAPARMAFARMRAFARKYPRHNLFIAGGETTIKVTGRGKGGRNQEAVLAALPSIKDNELFMAAASDGIDFTPHAGAIADALTKHKAETRKLDPKAFLMRNDSYRFFKATGDYLKTGKTGDNVADLLLYYKGNSLHHGKS